MVRGHKGAITTATWAVEVHLAKIEEQQDFELAFNALGIEGLKGRCYNS